MYSIHGFNAPKKVEEFVKGIPKKHFENISIIAVGCNKIWVNDAASLVIRKILSENGYSIMIDRVLAMPLTFIMKFSDQASNKIIEESEKEITSIASNLIDNIGNDKTILAKSKIISFVGRAEKLAAKMYGLELYANKNCVSCGKCWNNCPNKNIRPNKKQKPKFGFNCTMCQKCIYNCPQKAIKPVISRFIPIKGGYSIDDYR
jgi:ferredoxin